MARSKNPAGTPSRGKPSVTPEFGIELLSGQSSEAEDLLSRQPVDKNDFQSWDNTTRNYVEKAFGENHPNVEDFASMWAFGNYTWSSAEWSQHYAEGLQAKIKVLDGYMKQLRTEARIQEQSVSVGSNVVREGSKKVFIVHGHDGELKHATARLVTSLGFEPVILHEQPNKGRTIIEKFADHAEVGFAIVLLSADDEGRSRDTSSAPLKLRARQNVIFEMGFFFSRLSRERVCVVYESEVELPSDLSGILYVEYDSGKGWMYAVAQEMKAAGYEVDLNKA